MEATSIQCNGGRLELDIDVPEIGGVVSAYERRACPTITSAFCSVARFVRKFELEANSHCHKDFGAIWLLDIRLRAHYDRTSHIGRSRPAPQRSVPVTERRPAVSLLFLGRNRRGNDSQADQTAGYECVTSLTLRPSRRHSRRAADHDWSGRCRDVHCVAHGDPRLPHTKRSGAISRERSRTRGSC